jgi:hypothetical protein
MIDHVLFCVGLCFILTHEMDAVRHHEWAIFPGLARLNEEIGYVVFTSLHIPLYLLLFWGLVGDRSNGAYRSIITGLDIFFIVHMFLHVLFLRHPKNRFTSILSWVFILGAGIGGVLDLLLRA